MEVGMKTGKGISYIIIMAALIAQAILPACAFAAGEYLQPKPTGLTVGTDNGQYAIRFDSADFKHKVRLEWTQTDMDAATAALDESDNGPVVQRGYKIYTSTDNAHFNLYPANIPWGSGSGTVTVSAEIDSDGANPLKSGTIYYAYVVAFHRHLKTTGSGSTVETVHESQPSNTAIFMTLLDVRVTPVSSEAINITWDDVKFNGMRIDYDIAISESKDFAQPRIFNVRQQNIGSGGPVVPIAGSAGQNGRLSFVARGADFGMRAGTVYYVKVRPKNVWEQIKFKPENDMPAIGYTQIIAVMSRLSDQWWRIDWNPVTESSLGSDQSVTYQIKRGSVNDQNPIMVTIAETTDRKYPVNVTGGNYFYIVVAIVKDQYGNEIPDGIQSGRLTPVETPVPSTPTVPDLRDEIRTYYPDGTLLFSYQDNLASDKASVAWTPPRLADGGIDAEIIYDIWLLTNPDDLNNASAGKAKGNYRIGSDSASGLIKDQAGNTAGYRFTFDNLTPNTTYYLKIVAKKLFTVNEGDSLVQKYYESPAALKVVITPPSGPIDQPPAPLKPQVKKADGKDVIDKTSATVVWTNRWREYWDGTRWSSDQTVAGQVYRDIEYDGGITFRVGCAKYQDMVDQSGIVDNDKIRSTQYIKASDIPCNVTEYKLQGLEPNTAYVVWLRAYRQSGDLLSEPSDPIVIVTKPDIPVPVEKPQVPAIYYTGAGDTYVDLEWNITSGYTYYIKYSTSDSISSAQNTVKAAPADLMKSPVFRVSGLTQNTVYYFWIQADSTGRNIADGLSLWSDSTLVKTLPYIAPETPKGFGLKNSADAVGKDYLTFEWIQVPGLQYILEVASDITYANSKEYNAGAAGEYKVTGLRSNFRYAVRLYAFDPVKNMRSLPTQSNFMVRTLRSGDDYDSNADTENVITGSFVVETTANGVWTMSVTGVNADRLIQKVRTDNAVDYKFDMTTPPANTNTRVLVLSAGIFGALTELRENIAIDSGYNRCIIRPYVFDTRQVLSSRRANAEVDFRITMTDDNRAGNTTSNGLKYRSKTASISIDMIDGNGSTPLLKLNKPLKMSFMYTDENLFKSENAAGYYYDPDAGRWVKCDTSAKYDMTLGKGYASFDINAPGKAAVMTKTGSFADIQDDGALAEIKSIASKYDLKSIDTSDFRPSDNMTRGEAVKIMMDILGYGYGSDYALSAAKAGFVDSSAVSAMGAELTRKEFLRIVDRLYEKMTGSKAEERVPDPITDDQPVTRSEAMVELYNMLKNIGEL